MCSYRLGINKPQFFTVIQFRCTGRRLRNGETSENITSLQGNAVEDNWRNVLNEKLLNYKKVKIYDRT